MNLLPLHVLRLFFVLFVSTHILSALVFTEEEKKWIVAHTEIKIGVDRVWEPFDFINDKGLHDGMSADYLALISQKSGLKFTVQKHKKWSDVLNAAKNRELDMIAALAPSEERAKYMDFTDAYMTYAFVVVTLDKNEFFYDMSDFNGKRVGVIKSYITEDIVREKYKQIQVVSYNNLETLLKALASGEVDAIFDNAVSIAYHIRKQGYSHMRMIIISKQKRSINMGVVKGNDILLSILNKTLKSISEAEKKKIREKWVSLEYEKTIDYSLVYFILFIFLLFIIGTWYWSRKLQNEVVKRQQSEAQMHMLIDTIPLSVIVSSVDGSILRANAFALKTFDSISEDISKHNTSEFYANATERDEIISILQNKGRVDNRIVKFKRLDKSEMRVMLSIIPIVYDAKKAFLSIVLDLTEQIEREEDLRKAKQIADKANKTKSEFLANMSHEIRTPMNAIIGFTELLNEQVKTPRLKSYTKIIKNAGDSLLILINDILDLSKIEAGKLEIEKSAVNIYDIVDDVASIFSMAVADKGLSIVIDIDETIPKSLLLDGIRLRQVLVNLVGNAVKFTQEGYIILSIHALNTDKKLSKLDLEISVEDTGIGIPPSQRENIFYSFEQQEGQDNRKFGGTGLGLSISKRLVEMMDGTITVQSRQSKGTTFFVYLYGVEISSLEVVDNFIKKEQQENNILFKAAKILIVDDIENNRELIVKNFEESKIEIITASDGMEAIEQYNKEKPDLILMDIRMPNMDGYEAAKKIRQKSDVPIVALTASVMKDDYEKNKSTYFDGYLRKPILKNKLYATLAQFLKHDIVEVVKKSEDDLVLNLSDFSMKYIDGILEKMYMHLNGIHKKAITNNNIADIKAFVKAVDVVATKYKIEFLEEYVIELNEAIDTFDINQMRVLLRSYEEYYNALKLI